MRNASSQSFAVACCQPACQRHGSIIRNEKSEILPFRKIGPPLLRTLRHRRRIAANLKATVIIQHDARDVEKLPASTAFAK